MAWIDLTEAKKHLNKTSNTDDGELDGFIEAACAMVEDLVGVVESTSVDEVLPAHRVPSNNSHRYWAREHVILLSRRPVASVTAVWRVDGGVSTSVVAQDLPGGVVDGWRRVDDVLIVPFATTYGSAYRVQYVAGYDDVPPNYRLAALKIVAQMWRNSQLNAGGGGLPPVGAPDEEYAPGASYPLSFEVRQLLGIYGSHVGPQGGVTLA